MVKYKLSELSNLICANVKRARIKKGYTQYYVACHLKISQNSYSKIEMGKSNLNIERALDLIEILDIPFSELVKGMKD